jgi:hypothetical protein
MSNDESWNIPAPAFKADEAVVQVKRALRELKLAERGNAFEQHGNRVVEIAVEGETIQVKLARRPMQTPEWDRLALKSAADARKLMDEIKKRLARWEHEE